jgi:hypothetical protein
MWQSVARWPFPEVATGNADNTSVDKHDTREQADAVVCLLKRDGFGGDRKIFPLEAWAIEAP